MDKYDQIRCVGKNNNKQENKPLLCEKDFEVEKDTVCFLLLLNETVGATEKTPLEID
jgi:hypothetical protein